MKTKLTILNCVLVLFMSLWSCKDCSECENKLKELEESSSTVVHEETPEPINTGIITKVLVKGAKISNFCTQKCAIDSNKTYFYDTELGIAVFEIPYPDKMTHSTSFTRNSVTVHFTGSPSESYNSLYVMASGMSETQGDTFTVNACFDYEGSGCIDLAEKHKKSVIQGHPFVGNNNLNCSLESNSCN